MIDEEDSMTQSGLEKIAKHCIQDGANCATSIQKEIPLYVCILGSCEYSPYCPYNGRIIEMTNTEGESSFYYICKLKIQSN